jgi:hypothetical protein
MSTTGQVHFPYTCPYSLAQRYQVAFHATSRNEKAPNLRGFALISPMRLQADAIA